jgi:hypothetical protein
VHKVQRGVQQLEAGVVGVGSGHLGQDGGVPFSLGGVNYSGERCPRGDFILDVLAGFLRGDPRDSNPRRHHLVLEGEESSNPRRRRSRRRGAALLPDTTLRIRPNIRRVADRLRIKVPTWNSPPSAKFPPSTTLTQKKFATNKSK